MLAMRKYTSGRRKEEQDWDVDFFNAGEGAAINEQVSSPTAAKSGQSESYTEDDLLGPWHRAPILSYDVSRAAHTVMEMSTRKTSIVLHVLRPHSWMKAKVIST